MQVGIVYAAYASNSLYFHLPINKYYALGNEILESSYTWNCSMF